MKMKPTKIMTLLSLAFGVSLLSGCAFNSQPPVGSNKPLYALDAVALQANKNMGTLVGLQTAATQNATSDANWHKVMFNLKAVPPQFDRQETFDFTGSAEQALESIGKLSGYTVSVFGEAPAEPIIVSLHGKNTPLIDTLRDLNAQIGNAADIRVQASNKMLIMNYNKKEMVGA